MADMTFEECQHLFDYVYETGTLIWKQRPAEEFRTENAAKIWNSRCANKPAGTVRGSSDRYLLLRYRGKTYRAHRIIWTMVNGHPPEVIDHINGDVRDNRIENLRSVSTAENTRNQKLRASNKTGVVGVHMRYKSWRAEIVFSGRRYDLGKFQDMESAIAARKAAEVAFGFHTNHGRSA